ncbi:hypothetical protein [Sphingomonas sp.]|uniref:hypothetical protein n=1 Tax=Sphingomonas sp. TaxID=28214 RepID=UPI001ECF8338|nr:hypothetical protein [Sphingomonas sp.]MBX3595406.1 hypothetical protein [Sphingomonas sp.]
MKEAVERIIDVLNQPLSNDERAAGWTQSKKAGYIPVFEKLLEQISRREPVPYFGIARSLDAYGLSTGNLCEMMYSVANETNDKLR